ncbi:hypothetical protein ACIRD6_06860 [Streptomyces sp. NPDC102473]|uniref:hypothetical protein n=1 Tax=Streptomyces sp. NPDC102473 TaxID=3366180 RepID=UPI0037F39480
MFIHPWDAALDAAEWQTWIADGHDFGILSVNGLPGPVVVPTHFTVDGTTLLIHSLRLDVTEVHAEFEHHDHKPVDQRTGTARRLTERGTALNTPTAAQQLHRLDRVGTWTS